MPRRKKGRERRGIHHRDAEDTKLRKDKEIGATDFGNPFDGLTALHNRSHSLARLKTS